MTGAAVDEAADEARCGDGLLVGLDVGGTKVRAVLAARSGAVLAERDEPTRQGPGLVGQLAGAARRVAGERWDEVVGVGVAVPGAVHPRTGRTARAQNLEVLETIDLTGALREALGRPVEVDNDVTAAAAAERLRRTGPERDHLVVVSVGTGIGAGIVADGRVLRGARGAAGEVADLPLAGDVHDPAHRRQGVLESQVGTVGVVAREAAARRAAGLDPVTGDGVRGVLGRAEAGDACARQVVAEVADDLAVAILAIVAVTDPALVVLAGGVGAHPLVVDGVVRSLAALGDDPPAVEVSAAADRASAAGAVALAALAAPSRPRPRPPRPRASDPAALTMP